MARGRSRASRTNRYIGAPRMVASRIRRGSMRSASTQGS